jgi:phospholipase/lecithinase/hemolysin
MKLSWMTRRLAAAVAFAALVASCGGGEPIERFVPTRLFVVGDETSVINSDGSKYTVNALVTGTTTLDCIGNPLWVQLLANAYGLQFGQCPTITGAAVTAQDFAVAGAKVADISAQIDALGAFAPKDLVTVLAGANDVFEQYALLNTTVNGVQQTEAVLTATLESRGEALAGQVNRVADSGGKVLISTVPDLGLTPFAVSQEALVPGSAALLSRLTKRFNAKLRIKIINDGRRIGLLLTDELIQALVRNPAGNGFVNVTLAVCSVPLTPVVTAATACTANTLITGGDAATYLWAGDRLLGFNGQRLLGNLALSRTSNNPF